MGKKARVAVLSTLTALLVAANPPDLPVLFTVFPSDNPWNWDISGFAVHPDSSTYIASIGSNANLRDDRSIPYNTVTNATATFVDVAFTSYPRESDPGQGFGSLANGTWDVGKKGNYPIPTSPLIEGGGDKHCLVVNTDTKLLYETYIMSAGPPWSAACGAVFDLGSNLMRPEGWTSGDAAGLPIFPGLLRYDEAIKADGITHALRFTAQFTQNAHIYPARHDAGDPDTNLPPMGLRVRLKASTDISGYSGVALEILKALKKHGLILADNGSAWFVSTTVDSRWSATSILGIRDMKGSDFEVVTSVDSSGNPILPVTSGGTGPPPPPPPTGGSPFGSGGGCGLTGLEAVLLLALRRRPRR